ncbi:Hypothetical protein SMAX5B_009879 [Scophthalmus maximus]|uniref:Uncharacterized protein n=1 Tax=Scophthalmus maximus TaxID=52904 RepID=A0A2U9BVG1_SCOMX|nr:Hypothetical protein SMAX5B_009879 [Scophthalmus maximus]
MRRIVAAPIQSNSMDLGRHSVMFRPSCRSSSPFSLTDLDMWDDKSHFTAQTSAWYGMTNVSGSGFLSKISTSTSGSTDGFRQNDPGLKKWQSLSHLAPEGATRPFPPTPGAELRAAQGDSSFRPTEVVHWLQDAQERIDTQLDRLRARDARLSYNITTAQLLDMKHKLSGAMSTLGQEKEAAEFSKFDKNLQRRELHEKVLRLEKDLLQMRSTLDRESNDRPTEKTPGSLSRTLTACQEDLNRQEKQKVDTELCKLREALKEAEARAKSQEDERNQALQQLQTSTETQRTLLSQIEEMNRRLSHTVSNHYGVQEQLSEANNKISQACLEKAILSTQVLKLEDEMKELKANMPVALSDRDHPIQNKAELHQRLQVLELQLERMPPGSQGCEIHDQLVTLESHNNKQDQETVLMTKESKALSKVNEMLTCELEMIKQKLDTSQSQLQELTAERAVNTEQIRGLEAERSELIRQKEELLSKMKEGGHEMKEKCCQLREFVEVLESEKQKLQDRCLRLEAKVLENEEKLLLLGEEYQKEDAVRVQNIEGLKAVASHWTEKWQKVALTLQLTQEELEDLRRNNFRNERESDSLLRVELDACKQELDLERCRRQALLHRYKDEGGEAVRTQDKETVTDLSESSLLWPTLSHSHSSQNKSPQVCIRSCEVQRLKEKLAEREKQLTEKEDALKSLERLRDTEKTEAETRDSALELKLMKKASEDSEGRADASTTDLLKTELEESRRRANQLQQEKTLAVQKLQTLNQLYPLKSLFKEREGNEAGKTDNTSAAAQTGTVSPQDWSPAPKAARTTVDRWSWQQGPGLMPVFEEDEESSDLPGGEEEPAGEAHAEGNLHDQGHQMSTEISNQREAKHENLLQAIRSKQPIQDLHTAEEKVTDASPDIEVPIVVHCADVCDMQRRSTSLYPDGIFLAELVDICSPDEGEEEGEDEWGVS